MKLNRIVSEIVLNNLDEILEEDIFSIKKIDILKSDTYEEFINNISELTGWSIADSEDFVGNSIFSCDYDVKIIRK